MNRLLALFLSGTMLAGETLPVFAEEPVTAAVSDEEECEGAGEEYEFVPGYIDLPEDHDVPAVKTGLSYGEMRAELEQIEDPDLFTAPREAATESAYPAAYDGEWLAYLKDTFPATRNQNPYGSCWAHSSIFLAEAYLIRHGMASKDIDLSELHMVYWMYNNGTSSAAAQGTGDSVQSTSNAAADNKSILDYGGNLRHSAQTLMRQRGYAAESTAPYTNASAIADGGTLEAATERQDSIYLTNAYEISIKDNPGLVKSAIRENGAVGVSYHSYPSSNKTYYNDTHNAFWNPVDTNTNHAVIAVGWDDNFPKEYFNAVNGKQPENNGAWLIRNSWTTTAQASYRSYFWMSYEDTSLAESAWVFEADTAFPYDNHYYYDSQIYSTSSYTGSSEKKFANVYTVNGAAGAETETLEAVDFNVSNIGATGSSYKVEIYRDLTGETPDTGTLASTTEGNVYFRGQYTVKLTEPVVLEKGSSYAVVVSFGVPTTSIALTRDISGSGRYYSATAHCEGKSYLLFSAYSGSKWDKDSYDYAIGALTVDGNTSGVNHVTGVSLDKTGLTMGEGETTTLSATVTPEDADDQSLTWESNAPEVATVDENGNVTAVKAGSATITVTTTDGGYTASCNVTVKAATVNVTGVSLDQETLKLSPGQSETLTATVAPENADDLSVTWTSDDPAVATVDKGGKVTAVAAGETTVTVTTNDGGYEAECVVTVSEDLQIRVENVAATITTGVTMKVEVTVIPETAETPEYVWSSSDPTVATVDENGEIKALAAGTTTITVATADGKAETSFVLTVVEITIDVKGIEIDQVTMKLMEGETKKLAAWVTPTNATNRNITFSSGDEDVAIVDKNGIVTAVAEGTTGITATSQDGEFAKTCSVTVTAPVVNVTGVSLDENELELTVGEEKTLTAVVEPENATNKKVSWSSDNEAAATVDENGKVTAVAAGEAMITVTTEDGSFTDECLVTVQTQTVALTGLEIDPETLELIVGDTAALSAFMTPENTTETDLLWTSSASKVVRIDSVLDNDAEITALSAGTATITVSNADKTITAICEVTVEEAPEETVAVTGVSLDESELTLIAGEDKTLTASVEPEDATDQKVSWSSDNEAAATVDENGKVTAVAAGETTITVTTEDGGYTATCEVTVEEAPEETVAVTGVSLELETLELKVEESTTLTAIVEPENATDKSVIWSSSDEAVATVSETGEVTGVAEGTAVITVTTTDGAFTAACEVVVLTGTVVIPEICLDQEALQLKEGEKAELALIVSPENAEITQFIWSSDNEAAVTVKASEDGKSAEITAVKAGTAKIDVVAENGASASCTVEVSKTVDYGKAPRVITENDGSIMVYVDNQPVSDYTGIAILGMEEDAPWVYMENGRRNQKYTGYVDYDGSKFYISGGTLDTGLNGVMIDPNSHPYVWYFNANGQVQTQHVGLALYDGEWFYIKNGRVATGMNAFVAYDGGLFAVGDGRIISEYSGLMQDPENTQTGDWYFFAKGQAQTQYTGLTEYDGHWFYVTEGYFDPNYTGTVWYDGAQFDVVNGEAVVE